MLLPQLMKQRPITTVMQKNGGTIKTFHSLGPLMIAWEEHIFRDLDLGSVAMKSTKAVHTCPTGFGPREQRLQPMGWPAPELSWTDRELTSNGTERANPSRTKTRATTP
jgi:hypothetical protein